MFESLAAQLDNAKKFVDDHDPAVLLDSAEWCAIVDAKAAIVVDLEVMGHSGLAKRVDGPFDELCRVLNDDGCQSNPFHRRNAFHSLTAMLRAIHRIRGRLAKGQSDSSSLTDKQSSFSGRDETASRRRSGNTEQSDFSGDNSPRAAQEPQRQTDETVQHRRGAGEANFIPTPAMANILMALAKAMTTMHQVDIEQASGRPSRIVKDIVPALEKMGYVHRPNGPRKGYAITDKGRELLTRKGQAGG